MIGPAGARPHPMLMGASRDSVRSGGGLEEFEAHELMLCNLHEHVQFARRASTDDVLERFLAERGLELLQRKRVTA